MPVGDPDGEQPGAVAQHGAQRREQCRVRRAGPRRLPWWRRRGCGSGCAPGAPGRRGRGAVRAAAARAALARWAARDISRNPAAETAAARQQARMTAALLAAMAAGVAALAYAQGGLSSVWQKDLHVSSVQLLARSASSTFLLAYHEILARTEMARDGEEHDPL